MKKTKLPNHISIVPRISNFYLQIKVYLSLFLRVCQATSYWLCSVGVTFPDRISIGGKKRGHKEVLCVLTATPGVFQLTYPICAEDVTACISWYICYVLLLAQKGGKRFWPQHVTPVGLFLGQAQPHMARTRGPKRDSAFRQQHRYCQSRVSTTLFHIKNEKMPEQVISWHFSWSFHEVFHLKLKYYTLTVIILHLFLTVFQACAVFFLLPKDSLIMHQDSDWFFHFGKTDLVSSITPAPQRRQLK